MLEIYDKRNNTGNKEMKIGAVIVLYRIKPDDIKALVDKFIHQVDTLCLVDNTPFGHDDNTNHEVIVSNPEQARIKYIPIMENKGIAYAQNVGIRCLDSERCDFAIFSDQDSIPEKDTVNKLLAAYMKLEENNVSVGIVGTTPYNKISREPYPLKSKVINGDYEVSNIKLIETYSVISSISMIRLKHFETVGGFDNSLFIDGVDHEWCWRAWHLQKLRSFMVKDAVIYHYFGEGDKSVGKKSISIASSFRLYYQYRNYLWLVRDGFTPKFWKKKNGIKYLIKFIYYPLFVPPRLSNLKNICRGVIDGITKKHNQEWHNIPIKKGS